MTPPCPSEYLFSSFQTEPTRFCKHWVPHLGLVNSHQTKALPSHPTCPDSSCSVSHREAASLGCVDPIPYSHHRRARGTGQTDDVARVAPAYEWVTRLSRLKGSEEIAGGARGSSWAPPKAARHSSVPCLLDVTVKALRIQPVLKHCLLVAKDDSLILQGL